MVEEVEVNWIALLRMIGLTDIPFHHVQRFDKNIETRGKGIKSLTNMVMDQLWH